MQFSRFLGLGLLSLSLNVHAEKLELTERSLIGDLVNQLTKDVEDLLQNIGNEAKCGACNAALDVAKAIIKIDYNVFATGAVAICTAAKIEDPDVVGIKHVDLTSDSLYSAKA